MTYAVFPRGSAISDFSGDADKALSTRPLGGLSVQVHCSDFSGDADKALSTLDFFYEAILELRDFSGDADKALSTLQLANVDEQATYCDFSGDADKALSTMERVEVAGALRIGDFSGDADKALSTWLQRFRSRLARAISAVMPIRR